MPRIPAGVLVPLFAAALTLGAAAPARATTYVPVDDAHLVDRATLIVHGTVELVEAAPPGAPPALEYRVAVETALKGTPPGTLVVRVPGNPRPASGLGLRIFGAPEFLPGDRVLLFLAPNLDGTWHVLHLFQGAFVETSVGGRRWAVQPSRGARAVSLPSSTAPAPARTPREFARLLRWARDRAAGRVRDADYAADPGTITPRFALFEDGGFFLRWFDFEFPRHFRTVRWTSHFGGQLGLPKGGHRLMRDAIRAWNNHRGSTIRYDYAGLTAADGGLDFFDGENSILFEVDFGEPFSCAEGGVLAIGGPWYDPEFHEVFRGEEFISILGADIIVNEGLECFFDTAPFGAALTARELFAHELGHTLGLDHSCEFDEPGNECDTPAEDDALMNPFIHEDGRGASLASDDVAAICRLYPRAGLDAAACVAR